MFTLLGGIYFILFFVIIYLMAWLLERYGAPLTAWLVEFTKDMKENL